MQYSILQGIKYVNILILRVYTLNVSYTMMRACMCIWVFIDIICSISLSLSLSLYLSLCYNVFLISHITLLLSLMLRLFYFFWSTLLGERKFCFCENISHEFFSCISVFIKQNLWVSEALKSMQYKFFVMLNFIFIL